VCCLIGAAPLPAQETNLLEQLQKQLEQMQKNFEKTVEEQRRQIESLSRQVEELKKTRVPQSTNAATSMVSSTTPPAGILTNAPPVLEKNPWSPSDPIRIGTPQSYLGISFDSLFAVGGMNKSDEVPLYEPGGHDPKQNGFTVQNLELIFDGKVDPYFSGQANIVLQITPEGETTIEAEEAFLQTLSLPWNLQFKAGIYLTQFGRLNTQHPHSWDFVDVSLVNARFLGPEGLRNPGVQLSWLVPTPFYSELFFSMQNPQGETAYSFEDTHDGEFFLGRLSSGDVGIHNMGDILYAPRYAVSFDLNDQNTVVWGASGAFGPNSSGTDGYTKLYGTDLFYKWKSANASKGFPFVTWQTEWMARNYDATGFQLDQDNDGILDIDLPAETLRDWGLYSQVSYGFTPRWVASFRGDYLNGGTGAFGTTVDNDRRWRLSPALTWYPSEFSKIRLQYNYDDFQTLGPAWGIWMQFEFLLGAHSAHKF
jgi:hypothetical protein